MLVLDATDVGSSLCSLARAAGVAPNELAVAISEYDELELETGGDEAPAWLVPRQVFGRLGVDLDGLRFDGVRYFHGTRVADPADFLSRGILPLDQVLEEMWRTLFELVAHERTAHEWAAFRASVETGNGSHSGSLYRLKTGGRIHFGPHGTFVREVLLNPRPPAHDYLGGPEIVEDIAVCYSGEFGTNLMERFWGATTPCIVTFDPGAVEPEDAAAAVNSAFWLVYDMLRVGHAGLNANGGGGLDGQPVSPARVMAVDVCEPVLGRDRLYCVVERINPSR